MVFVLALVLLLVLVLALLLQYKLIVIVFTLPSRREVAWGGRSVVSA